MTEPRGCVALSDGFYGLGYGLVKRLSGACFGSAQILLELEPRSFNRVQVSRVWRQVEHLRPVSLDPLAAAVGWLPYRSRARSDFFSA